jgi:NADPH:quinone reductase-like Zn-dependent oxidoreductase
MHAVTIVEQALEWREHDDPVPGRGEVLVSVRAAGINGADPMQVRGGYPAPPGWPQDIPGMEFAGEVAGFGRGAARFQLGDRVMGLCGGGGQAELIVVPESALVPVPPQVPFEQAGGFPEVFSTAYDALFTRARLSVGERVVVSGAAGGVGTAAVQLAYATGAFVVATVRNTELHDAVRALGADVVVEPDGVVEYGPFDVSLELVGAPGVAAVLPLLATGGRIVVIGVGGAGAKVELNLLQVMAARAFLTGSTLRGRTEAEKAAVTRAVEAHVVPLLAAGSVAVPVTEIFPMAEAQKAYERFTAGKKLGKIVLVTE